jgi:hypothetical protein
MRSRLEAALEHPADRALLVWPTILGAPRLREQFPGGLRDSQLLPLAARMLAAVGAGDPEAAWSEARERLPDTAEPGPDGWLPHRSWGALSPLVSLRCGVALAALTGLPADERYPLSAGVLLFECALFHETHDALEALWKDAQGDLRQGLQGLILMTAGYHHQQLHRREGMVAVWEDALERLAAFQGALPTPWGTVHFAQAFAATAVRLEWLREVDPAVDLSPLFGMDRPRWELILK